MTDRTARQENPVVQFIKFQNTDPDAQSLVDYFLSLLESCYDASLGLRGTDHLTGDDDRLMMEAPEGWSSASAESFDQAIAKHKPLAIPIIVSNRQVGILYLFSGEDSAYQDLPVLIELLAQGLERNLEKERIRELSFKLNKESQRNNLLYSIAHDLRTPLTGIIGLSEVLLDMEQNDEEKRVVKEIRGDAVRLHEILENVLSLVRLSQESLHIPKQLECINEIAEEAIETFAKGKFKNRRIELVGDELLFAQVNARLIYQVLINLIDNAIKHSASDSTILVRIFDKEGSIHIEVLDEGEGIAPAHLPHLFDLYFTTRANRENHQKGTGLGLPICSSIIQAHNGSINACNREDRSGALFSIVLPAAPVQA